MEIEIKSQPTPEDTGAFRAARLFSNYVLTPGANPRQPMHGAAILRLDPAAARKEKPIPVEVNYSAPKPWNISFPRLPMWLIVLLALGVLYAAGVAVEHSNVRQDAAKAKAGEGSSQSFYAGLHAIATPSAFMQACGAPAHIEQLGAPAFISGTTRLDYRIGAGELLRVYLTPDRTVGFDTLLHGRRYLPSGPEQARDQQMLAQLHCRLP